MSRVSCEGMDGPGVHKAKGRKACARCHRRKQRCVGSPVCTNCHTARVACLDRGGPASERFAGWSHQELLGKIHALESQATLHLPGLEDARGAYQPFDASPPSTGRPAISGSQGETQASPNRDILQVNDQQEPHTSEATPSRWVLPSTPFAAQHHATECHQSRHQVRSDRPDDGKTMDPSTNKQYLLTYFENMHRRLPFVDLATLGPSAMQCQMNADQAFATGRQYLVYAIGARVARLTSNQTSSDAEYFLGAAQVALPSMEPLNSMQRLEVSLLVVIYELRSTLSPDTWYLVGTCMRIAVDSDMHKAESYRHLEPRAVVLRKTLFCVVYVLERVLSFALGKPFSLSDSDIDEEVFSIDKFGSLSSQLHDVSWLFPDTRPLDYRVFEFTLQLTRIKSRIHNAIHRQDRMSALTRAPGFLEELQSLSDDILTFQESDQDFAQLHLNNAIRMLLEPFTNVLEPGDNLSRECLRACGKTCQMVQRMRIRGVLAISAPMVRSVFTAGMTICYILAKEPGLLSPANINDLRACSSGLAVIAERNTKFRVYFEVLEDLITGVVDQLPTGSSSPAAANQASAPSAAFRNIGDAVARIEHARIELELPPQSWPSYTYTLKGDQMGQHQPGNSATGCGKERPCNLQRDEIAAGSSSADLQDLITNLDSIYWDGSGIFDIAPDAFTSTT